jgi:hypothetical protein
MPGQHEYISTACQHGECGSCRRTCKYCDASCRCPLPDCHHGGSTQERPAAWVDQARGIARQLLADGGVSLELARRIEQDPALFWLRGEEVPQGTWRNDAG